MPLILAMAMFAWGAIVYVDYRHTPGDTLDIYVIGKQWMWKVQQPDGLKEINELHVPVGRNVRLIMASEDVIHDFSVPAFRVKMDVVPGHYNTHVVPAHPAGPLSSVLLAVLRHESRGDGRLGHGDGAGRIRRVAFRLIGADARSAGGRRETLRRESLHHLPSVRTARAARLR